MTGWMIDHRQGLDDLGEIRMLRVRIIAGDVNVVGRDGPARLEVNSIEGPPLHVDVADGELTISYDDLSWSGLLSWLGGGRRQVSLSVAVPPDCRVELGVVSASAVVAGIRARASIRSVSGDVTLDELGDGVDVQTVSGDLETRALAGPLTVNTVSGELTVAGTSSSSIRVRTVSGDVIVDVEEAGHTDIEAASVSGDVTLRLPESVSAQVEVTSMSGDLSSAFEELAVTRKPAQRRLDGQLGDGAGRLHSRTVSGDVALLRRAPE